MASFVWDMSLCYVNWNFIIQHILDLKSWIAIILMIYYYWLWGNIEKLFDTFAVAKKPVKKAKVTFAYVPQQEDELALEVGNIVDILKQVIKFVFDFSASFRYEHNSFGCVLSSLVSLRPLEAKNGIWTLARPEVIVEPCSQHWKCCCVIATFISFFLSVAWYACKVIKSGKAGLVFHNISEHASKCYDAIALDIQMEKCWKR